MCNPGIVEEEFRNGAGSIPVGVTVLQLTICNPAQGEESE